MVDNLSCFTRPFCDQRWRSSRIPDKSLSYNSIARGAAIREFAHVLMICVDTRPLCVVEDWRSGRFIHNLGKVSLARIEECREPHSHGYKARRFSAVPRRKKHEISSSKARIDQWYFVRPQSLLVTRVGVGCLCLRSSLVWQL